VPPQKKIPAPWDMPYLKASVLEHRKIYHRDLFAKH
jgi:hypothetical protein